MKSVLCGGCVILLLGITGLLLADQKELTALADELSASYRTKKEKAVLYARQNNFPVRSVLPSGNVIEIQDVILNRPLYYRTTNLTAAKTISSQPLWPASSGGNGKFNLCGRGVVIGMWDGGDVRFSHVELDGRVQNIDNRGQLSAHATQVAGTLVAQGYYQNAHGMAPGAYLEVFDWNHDLAEMGFMAAETHSDPSQGLMLSNHSYSYLLGWEWNYYGDNRWVWFGDSRLCEKEDYLFGFYDEFARDLDQLACAAPYYLMIFSAGNDRKDLGPVDQPLHWCFDWQTTPPERKESTLSRQYDGLYDSISNGGAVAKNSLTVGAVEGLPNGYSDADDVLMSWFSAWGPTDDGRIKPDVVAAGVAMTTTGSENDRQYVTVNGTSFAAPGITASLALLQQYYHRTHNKWMRSATLKALAIHNSDEAGKAPGPDYAFGWGLMNTQKAANLIKRDSLYAIHIQELDLQQGKSDTLCYYGGGDESIKATMVWTDPGGNPVEPQLDPSVAMLTNDLDLKIEMDGRVYYPWILDPQSPDTPAQRGINSVDNVEQVFIENASAGFYKIVCSHKQALTGGRQSFSLILSGLSQIDMGDAPPDRYPTLLSQDGAYHLMNRNIFLGYKIERETADKPADMQGEGYELKTDNDGVGFSPYIAPGYPVVLKVTVNGSGYLHGWMDWNADGDWEDADEKVLNGVFQSGDEQQYIIHVPSSAKRGQSYARFRFCTQKSLGVSGPAPDGEVEDYPYTIYADSDHDGIVNVLESRDSDGNGIIDSLQYTPSGYIYDELSGKIVRGGQVRLFAANGDTIPLKENGSKGFYHIGWLHNAGEYTLHLTPPAGYRLSQKCANQEILQVDRSLTYLGCSKANHSNNLSSHRCEDNPFALTLRTNEPAFIALNNLPVSGLVPVELVSFTADFANGAVHLNWITGSETENLGFHLYRKEGDSSRVRTRITPVLIQGAGNSQTGKKYEFIDRDIEFNRSYRYELIDIDFQGHQTVHGPVQVKTGLPRRFELQQNYPNPFNPRTQIPYHLDDAGHCRLVVFNLNGQQIKVLANGHHNAGSYVREWDGRDEQGKVVPSGIYLYRLVFNGRVKTRKMSYIH